MQHPLGSVGRAKGDESAIVHRRRRRSVQAGAVDNLLEIRTDAGDVADEMLEWVDQMGPQITQNAVRDAEALRPRWSS